MDAAFCAAMQLAGHTHPPRRALVLERGRVSSDTGEAIRKPWRNLALSSSHFEINSRCRSKVGRLSSRTVSICIASLRTPLSSGSPSTSCRCRAIFNSAMCCSARARCSRICSVVIGTACPPCSPEVCRGRPDLGSPRRLGLGCSSRGRAPFRPGSAGFGRSQKDGLPSCRGVS